MKQKLDDFINANKNSINLGALDVRLNESFEDKLMLKIVGKKQVDLAFKSTKVISKDYTKLILTSVIVFFVFTLILILYFIQQYPLPNLELQKSYNLDFLEYFNNKIVLFVVITFAIYMLFDIKIGNRKQNIA